MARGFRSNRTYRSPGSGGAAGSPPRRGGGSGVVDHALHNNADHFIPWVVLLAFGLAGMVLHAFTATTWSLVGMVVLILLGTVGMTWSVWHTNLHRTATARWHGVLSTGLGGAWLALCTVTGMITFDLDPQGMWLWSGQHYTTTVHGFTIATYFALGASLAAVWNTRINHRHRAAELAELLAQQKPEMTPMERAGHKGCVLTLRRVSDWRSEGTLVLAPGDTLQAFQSDITAVETAHGFRPNSLMVSQRKNSNNSAICDVTLMHGNPLEKAEPWPGLLVGAK